MSAKSSLGKSTLSSVVEEDAIVLRRIEFGDSSLILHLLTEGHGIITALAKGAFREKSPLLGMLDLPFWIHAKLHVRSTREIQLLSDASLHSPFAHIRGELRRYYLALFAIELVEEAGQPSGTREMFALFREFLSALDNPRSDPGTLWILFELLFLAASGIQPSWEACASCGALADDKASLRFFPSLGGAACARCAQKSGGETPISLPALRVAARLAETSLGQLSRVKVAPEMLRQIQRALDGFLHYHWGRMPRTRNFMEI